MSARRLHVVGQRESADVEVLADRPPCPIRAVAVLQARDEIAVAGFRAAILEGARHAGIAAQESSALPAPDVELWVGGPELARRFRPWLLVVISGGLPRAAWTGVARAVQDEVDLVLADPREAVARAIPA